MQFTDSEVERHYRDSQLKFRLNAIRVATTAMAGVWLSFIFLNALAIHDPSPPLLYVRLSGLVINVAVLGATFVAKPGRWIAPVGFVVIALAIVQNMLLRPFMSPVSLPYIQATEIAMLIGVGAFCACVTFFEGIILAAALFCASLFSVVVFWHEPALFVVLHCAWLSSLLAAAGSSGYLLDRAQRVVWLREMDLRRAEEQIRNLLHNVLPPPIAARKLAGEAPIADQFSEAALLFADVVGFTTLSARLESTEIVTMLSDLFSRFDAICARYGLEKIKTIGDCYMVAAGIPEPLPDPVNRLARAAILMLAEVDNITAPDGSRIAVRIGMHSGPVTAGVIGDAKFIFDVWGDTVNTASRMESHGAPGRIQVTDAVRTVLAGQYEFEGPHTIDVKGKGPTRVWWLAAAIAVPFGDD
jgi:class 3 adenylate cyclase